MLSHHALTVAGVLLGMTHFLPIVERARRALQLREALRTAHKDVRMNSKVWKTAREFLDAQRDISWTMEDSANTSSGKKRSRVGSDEESDGDYRPTP